MIKLIIDWKLISTKRDMVARLASAVSFLSAESLVPIRMAGAEHRAADQVTVRGPFASAIRNATVVDAKLKCN